MTLLILLMKNKIHPLSDVQTRDIGNDTYVWQYTVILENSKIGNNCNINCNCFIENDVIVGNNVTIKSGVQIWDGIQVEDDVFIGPNATFTNDLVPRSKSHTWQLVRTLIKKGASIGANSTIIAGVVIGEYALIGAGSVVTKDILPYTIWYGNPSKMRGYITKDGILLDRNLIDNKTKDQYILEGNKPVKK